MPYNPPAKPTAHDSGKNRSLVPTLDILALLRIMVSNNTCEKHLVSKLLCAWALRCCTCYQGTSRQWLSARPLTVLRHASPTGDGAESYQEAPMLSGGGTGPTESDVERTECVPLHVVCSVLFGCGHGRRHVELSYSPRESSTDCCTVNQELVTTAMTSNTLTATKTPPNSSRFPSSPTSTLINNARKLLKNMTTQPCRRWRTRRRCCAGGWGVQHNFGSTGRSCPQPLGCGHSPCFMAYQTEKKL